MKLHQIEIQNIASLKGKHSIDFDSINLNSNLFAITGKTGSGKSSILNSISLALFGEVYKKGSTSTDYITLGEAEGEIGLTFSSGFQKYYANWRLRVKKKNGETLKKPQLTRLLYRIENEEKIAIETPIEEICSLNFNQFCKTTILNQGEFSRFLTSNFTERKEILERFYQGHELERLNVLLREKIKENTAKKEELENLIRGINQSFENIDIDEDELIKLKDQLNDTKSFNVSSESLITLLKDSIGLKENENDLNIRIENLNKNLDNAQNNFNLVSKENNILEDILKKAKDELDQKKPILEEAIKKEIQLNEILKGEENSKKETALKKQQILKNQNEIEELVQNQQLKQKQIKDIQESNTFINKLSQEEALNKLENISKLGQEYKYLNENLKRLAVDKTNKNLKKENLLKETEDCKLEINNYDLNKTQELQKKYSDDINFLKNALIKTNNYLKECNKAQAESDKVESTIAKLRKDKNILQTQIGEIIVSKTDIEAVIKLHELASAIHQCQEESISKGECVVCGNSQININLEEQLPNQDEFLSAKSRLEEKNSQKEQLDHKFNDLKIQLLSFEKDFIKINDQIKSLQSELIVYLSSSPTLNATKEINEQYVTYIESKLQDLQKKENKLSEDKNDFIIKSDKLKNLTTQLNQVSLELSTLDLTINDQNKNIESCINKSKDLVKDLDLKEKVSTELIQKLKGIIHQYHSTTQSLTLFDTKIKSLESTIETLNNDIQKRENEQKKLQEEKNEISNFLSSNTDSGKPSLELKTLEYNLQNSSKNYQQNIIELRAKEIELAEYKSKHNLSLEQLKNTHSLLLTVITQLQSSAREFSTSKLLSSSQEKILKNIIDINNSDFEANLFKESKVIFENSLKESKAATQDLIKKLSEIEALKKQIEDNLQKIESIKKDLKEIDRKKNELDDLNLLLGKDEFRNYVLAIIENLLLEQTNKELKILCNGRYGIIQTNKTNRMASEFKVVDYYLDGMERKISTLSGGETFLVSLAMAMALAELTRGTAQIDSLFIDEGFGTLDEEAINEVYELLVDIQSSGKQIGIISHIKALTERIPVNIHLEKSQNGISDINVLLN